jgi:hypothetical protein
MVQSFLSNSYTADQDVSDSKGSSTSSSKTSVTEQCPELLQSSSHHHNPTVKNSFGQEVFPFTTVARMALEPTQLHVQ